MKLHPLDLVILVVYMLATLGVGWWFSRRQRNVRDYFLSGTDTPWWALMASIVATETSTVTFISVPAFAFAANANGVGGNFTFLQIVVGYLIGRVIIVWLFIPLYFKGELFTVYQVLDQRFGGRVKRTAASLFLVTRSIADGIRLFLTAIVLVALMNWAGQTWGDLAAILIVGVVTIAYTYLGGMAAVIWTDAIQLVIYLLGAVAAAMVLLGQIPGGWNEVMTVGSEFQKFTVFDFTFNLGRSYTFWAGVIGGAFLNTASHGVDQLIVQRLLAARNERDTKIALLSSGVVIFFQFALFLLIGIMLYAFYHYNPGAALPSGRRRAASSVVPVLR